MLNAIIFGDSSEEIISDIYEYINDDCSIIGQFDEDNAYKLSEYSDTIDYYIIVCKEMELEIKIKCLLDLGIPKDKIVYPTLLYSKQLHNIPDLYRIGVEQLSENKCELVSLGLSYSLRGIDFSRLPITSIDFSWHGLDLYYNYLFLKTALKYRSDSIKKVLLVFPLYYLNFDMSKSVYQFTTGQILGVRGFNDWHNALTTGQQTIDFFIDSISLWGDKYWNDAPRERCIPKTDLVIDEKSKAHLSDLWKKRWANTVEENKKILVNVIKLVSEYDAYFIIPPLFKSGIDESEYHESRSIRLEFIDFSREITKKYNVKFIDMTDLDLEAKYFYDYEHFNEDGRHIFTDILLKTIDWTK